MNTRMSFDNRWNAFLGPAPQQRATDEWSSEAREAAAAARAAQAHHAGQSELHEKESGKTRGKGGLSGKSARHAEVSATHNMAAHHFNRAAGHYESERMPEGHKSMGMGMGKEYAERAEQQKKSYKL